MSESARQLEKDSRILKRYCHRFGKTCPGYNFFPVHVSATSTVSHLHFFMAWGRASGLGMPEFNFQKYIFSVHFCQMYVYGQRSPKMLYVKRRLMLRLSLSPSGSQGPHSKPLQLYKRSGHHGSSHQGHRYLARGINRAWNC